MLVRVYTCQNATLLEITCHGLYQIVSDVQTSLNYNLMHILTYTFYYTHKSWSIFTYKHMFFETVIEIPSS